MEALQPVAATLESVCTKALSVNCLLFSPLCTYVYFVLGPCFMIELYRILAFNGPRREKKQLFSGFAINKGTDQPAHPRRLISAFIIRLLKSIISKLAINEISIF